MRWLGGIAAFFTVWLCLAGGTAIAGPDEGEDAADIEDPRRLEDLAAAALAAGERDQARALYEQAVARMEATVYLNYRPVLREALVLERLGEYDDAAAKYRESMHDDVHRTISVLRIMSLHPDRDALVQECLTLVRDLVKIAKEGGKAQIYTSSKGSPRYLEVLTTEEVLKRGTVQYCYVEDFDLTAVASIPDVLLMQRCVLGRIRAPNLEFGKIALMGIVLGDADFGKTWEGERNKSKTIAASTFRDLMMRETIFVGRANFWGVTVTEARGYFPMVVFEQEADFKGAEFWGDTEFRFASFGAGANFKNLRMHAPVYFGGSRYRADTVFTALYSERDVYFNSTHFEGSVSFDQCEFQRGATFEDADFKGTVNFGTTAVAKNLNLSRARFHGDVNIKEIEVGELDALGAHFHADAWFMDAQVEGRARFSLDEVTRHAVQEGIDGLLPLYRKYQGDEDADEPLTTRSSYGVTNLDDLSTRIDGNISFANTVFGGYTVFEGVTFGQEDAGQIASFFNTQFRGETHFERTEWHAQADFTTIFGREVAFNGAHFHRSLILDDANISGRVALTDATFAPSADLSFYGAQLASFQVEPGQVEGADGRHRLFYERCAYGQIDRDDVRIRRIAGKAVMTDSALSNTCYDYVIDELIGLKESYGNRAMTSEEDEAYWWTKHHQAMQKVYYGGVTTKVIAITVDLLLFQLCFGWGVRLGNLGIAVLLATVFFAGLYRVFCADTILVYDGEDVPVRDVSFFGLCFISLQSLIAINTGWDFGDDDHRFRWLNTIETVIGVIILTFFVGAYTRMILA